MAHRMFTTDITESDSFLELPVSSRELYFHLCMNADDWGFVKNPRTIMRSCGASNSDAKELIDGKFLLGFDNKSAILIKHWRMHNLIRKDRVKETAFKELLRGVYFDENSSYTMSEEHSMNPVLLPEKTACQPSDNQLSTNCQPSDNQLSAQDKLSKDKLSKDKLSKDKLIEGKKEEKEERNPSFCLSYTDDDFIGLDIPEPTKEDLRFLRNTSKDLYKAGVDKYRWRAQG